MGDFKGKSWKLMKIHEEKIWLIPDYIKCKEEKILFDLIKIWIDLPGKIKNLNFSSYGFMFMYLVNIEKL